MANRERNVGINIRVTPGEKKKIVRCAKSCRLNVSEYIRQVAVKNEPKAFIPKEIEDSVLRIRSVINNMDADRLTETDPVSKVILNNYTNELFKILSDTIKLMRNTDNNSEDTANGDY